MDIIVTRDTGHPYAKQRTIRAAQTEFGLAAKNIRAIDLSCRACGAGAGCWAWIPGRGTFGVEPEPPIHYARTW